MKKSKQELRKYMINWHFLSGEKPKGKEGMRTVLGRLRSVQHDPINVCGRNPELFFFARVSGINRVDLRHLLYEARKWTEIHDKEMCIVPREDVFLCRRLMSPSRIRKHNQFFEENKEKLLELLDFIKSNGPVCAKDLPQKEKVNLYREKSTWAKAALDTLWKLGYLVIVNRKGNMKYYDITSRHFGTERIAGAELSKEVVLRRIKSVGLLPFSGKGDGWKGIGSSKEIHTILEQLIKEGKLLQITAGDETYVVEKEEFEKFDPEQFKPRLEFLPPLDNMLWDRKLIKDLFGLDYKFEAYTPPVKRKYGYYTMPILFGDRFIGLIELRVKQGKLYILGLWKFENWPKEAQQELKQRVAELAEFLGVELADQSK